MTKLDNTGSAAPAVTDAMRERAHAAAFKVRTGEIDGDEIDVALEAALSAAPAEAQAVAWRYHYGAAPDECWGYSDQHPDAADLSYRDVQPLYASPPQELEELRAEVARLTQSRDGYAKDAAARAEECDKLRRLLAIVRDDAMRLDNDFCSMEARAEAAEERLKLAEQALEPFAKLQPIAITEVGEDGRYTIIAAGPPVTFHDFDRARSLSAIKGDV